MVFWPSVVQLAAKLENVRKAEMQLLEYARRYAANVPLECLQIMPFDTLIPRSAVPWQHGDPVQLKVNLHEKDDQLTMHAIRVQRTDTTSDSQHRSSGRTTETPLVLLHGYMNASAYFYRNLLGLGRYYRTVYSLDLLGWGLSSRPNFYQLKDASIASSEDFFVESIEAWRAENNIDKMILAGHSMGGYLSVAYCEKYPQRVERLILLSPVGVNDDSSQNFKDREARINSSYRSWAMFSVFRAAFATTTPGTILRSLSESRSYNIALGYVQRRLPEIEAEDEQKAIADYLYQSNTLPGSGEHIISRVLDSRIIAKRPLQFRIPKLQVDSVSFLYGSHDWMDISGGVTTQTLCKQQQSDTSTPNVDVHVVNNAGHLLMLQNWKALNAGIIMCGGGDISNDERKDLKRVTPMAGTI